ncbi:MAG: hypothetical protein ACI3VB_02835 [Oscillospiraceae bacterium]
MANGEKKRRGRRAYLDDFVKNAAGEYVYTGAHYSLSGGKAAFKKAAALICAASAVIAGLIIACGCIPAAGMDNCFYVIIPYAAGLISAGSVVWAACRLASGGNPMREYVYEATVLKLPLRCTVIFAFSILTFLCDVLFLILNGFDGKMTATIIFLAFELASGAASMWLKAYILGLSWSK